MGAISPLHLLLVAIVALVVIGPKRLPETGAALGKAIREFREATREDLPGSAAPAAPVVAAAYVPAAAAPFETGLTAAVAPLPVAAAPDAPSTGTGELFAPASSMTAPEAPAGLDSPA